MVAARYGRTEIMKMLLASGANANIKNKDGQNAYMIALRARKARSIDAIYPFTNREGRYDDSTSDSNEGSDKEDSEGDSDSAAGSERKRRRGQ